MFYLIFINKYIKYIVYHYPIFSYSSNPNFAQSLRHSTSRHTLRNSFEILLRPTSKVSLSFNFRHCPFNPQLLVAVVPWTSRGIPTPSVCIRHYRIRTNFFKILIVLTLTRIVALLLHNFYQYCIYNFIYKGLIYSCMK